MYITHACALHAHTHAHTKNYKLSILSFINTFHAEYIGKSTFNSCLKTV